jgi:hypothetical protein
MKTINKLIKKNTPFAVMKYTESFIMDKSETYKIYELMYLNKNNVITFHILNRNEINFIKNFKELKQIVLNDGLIYEFNNFQNHYKLKVKNNENNTNSND